MNHSKHKKGIGKIFDHFSGAVTKVTGKPVAFIVAFFVIINYVGINRADIPVFRYMATGNKYRHYNNYLFNGICNPAIAE